MLEESEKLESNAVEEKERIGNVSIRANNDIRIWLVVRCNMRVTENPHQDGMTLEWSASSTKIRNLKPVEELIKQLLLQVIAVDKKHLRAQTGLYETCGVYYPMASFIVHSSNIDNGRLKQVRHLMAAVPELLMRGAKSAVLIPWLSPAEHVLVDEVSDTVLMTCGGRSIPAAIEIMVDGLTLGTVRSQFASPPKISNLAPVREQFAGCVVGFSIKKGRIEFEEISGRGREIWAQVGSLDTKRLSYLMDTKSVVAAEVDTTTLPSGKLNHELVSI